MFDSIKVFLHTIGWGEWFNAFFDGKGNTIIDVSFGGFILRTIPAIMELWAIIACLGSTDFLSALNEHGRNNIKGRQIQLVEDYLDNNNDLTDECENMWAFLMSMYDYDDYESALRQLKEDSFYIRNMPADCDSREWIQSVFANGAVSCV